LEEACPRWTLARTGLDSEFKANHTSGGTGCSLELRVADVNALFTPGKCMAVRGPEATSTARSML